MSTRVRRVTHQAVLFFDGGRLVKEMLYTEFEAVLDQVVGLVDFAGREIRACFMRVSQHQQILGTLFFLVDFDERGFVNRSWNLPLQHLLDKAGRGPDLGAGRILLGCRSQCPVAWHQRQLWDPQLDGEDSTFVLLMAAVRRNRLGLPMVDPAEPEPLPSAPDGDPAALTRQLEALEAQHALQLATLRSESQQQTEQLHQHYRIQLSDAAAALESTKLLFRDEKHRNRLLQERLAQQVAEVREGRQQAELAAARVGAESAEIGRLREQFTLELKLKVEQATANLHEMLDMRDVELFYREEQLGSLRQEVSRLRQERDRLIQRGSARLLELLTESAVTLVVYSPGGEAITLVADALADYLDDPVGWLAACCGMSLEDFRIWQRHCEEPLCEAVSTGGTACRQPLEKVIQPERFFAGRSNRCTDHLANAVTGLATPETATGSV